MTSVDEARESARRPDGKFGEQDRPELTGVELDNHATPSPDAWHDEAGDKFVADLLSADTAGADIEDYIALRDYGLTHDEILQVVPGVSAQYYIECCEIYGDTPEGNHRVVIEALELGVQVDVYCEAKREHPQITFAEFEDAAACLAEVEFAYVDIGKYAECRGWGPDHDQVMDVIVTRERDPDAYLQALENDATQDGIIEVVEAHGDLYNYSWCIGYGLSHDEYMAALVAARAADEPSASNTMQTLSTELIAGTSFAEWQDRNMWWLTDRDGESRIDKELARRRSTQQ